MITGMCSLQLQRAIWSGSGPYDKVPNSPKPLQRCQFAQPPSFARISSHTVLVQTQWCTSLWKQTHAFRPFASQAGLSLCVRGLSSPAPSKDILNILTKLATGALTRVLKTSQESQVFRQCAPAIVLMIFAMWGLEPLFRIIRHTIFQKEDRKWKESQTRYLMTSYLRPILLWLGIILVCRSFDPLVLSTEASQAIKQRFLNFIRSLSTVLAFAYCTASLTQQLQKVMLDRQDSQDTRSVGAQFVGNAVYTAVWIAAVCLFMELLGFSTQKWLTAGGLGTVLLTLAGREIFTNFLSSVMIHATRPFVINEWIQTKIDGYEVSGTVEHVGWWSPTIVRGDDREAVHIPNHKFTVTVVRNLSQKSHWRIKTHFGISHLDVSKILSIVADMRKVLAKHPQVEQRRLHRRVFLENIDHENQALMVLVSCFVKTSHFEEYLRVKEVILLDLLKVISHHHARLATPIRSVQRVYDDIESRGAPFRDVNRSTEAQGRPYLLIEASATAGQRDSDQPKVTREPPSDGSEAAGSTSNESSYEVSVDTKGSAKPKQTQLEGLDSMGLNSKDITLLGAAFEKPPANIPEDLVSDTPQGEKIALRSSEGASSRGEKLSSKAPDQPSQPKHEKGSSKLSDQPSQPKHEKVSSKLSDQLSQPKHEKVSSKLSDQPSQPKHEKRFLEQASQYVGKKAEKPTAKASDEIEKKAFEQKAGKLEKPTVKASDESLSLLTGEDQNTAVDFADVDQGKRKVDLDQRIDTRRPLAHGTSLHGSSSKQENERVTSASSKPPIEENLVLGVALDGPKRTLPLDNEIAPPSEEKELVTSGNGNPTNASKERRDGSQSLNTNPSEGREK